MNLADLQQQLEKKLPPIESWQPTFCGDIPIHIENGTWYYQNSEITRQRLVKLFASVLIKEGDEYFLITPVEKVRIQVTGQPFIITTWQQHQSESGLAISVIDNIGREFLISQAHPLHLIEDAPVVSLPFNCDALLHRNVYYQLAELCHETDEGFYLTSAGKAFLFAKND